ncbi:sensor histidine kinase [Rhizobium sp. RU36D]|uniref:sensor histidine kinase n=1 Tax=Rhizobium sp. RU36D TaxID=1907415 RepID=UPI001FCDAA37|nr:sensor histidine kinase [Rhizobium sp. RU36D]
MREFFISALLDVGVSLTLQSAKGDYICITTLPPRWSLPQDGELTDTLIFGEEVGQRLMTLKESLRAPGDKAEIEVLVPDDCAFDFRCSMIQMTDGATYLMTTVIDRTEERRRERLLRALLREVSHRSKNLLAIIQSIAFQTARYSGTLEGFLNKFRGRLHSLSQSQDLITDSSWRGAYFKDLLTQQVEKYVPENRGLVHFSGENVLLSPNASLHIGLALHELAVNAVSHGSFLRQHSAIEVSCRRSVAAEGEMITVTWNEPFSAKPEPETEAAKPKFGSTVLERVVPASVNGRASLEFHGGRLVYELVFPVEAAD